METLTEHTPSQEPTALYKWSAWVHVGPGAPECDERESDCSNPAHFHAWCRLPNPFQHREIRETALAARARLVRRLRDPNSDAGAILEEQIEELHRLAARSSDDSREVRLSIIEELVQREWVRDYTEVMADLAEEVDDRDEHPYEFIERDQERYRELAEMEPDSRPAEEYEHLERFLSQYGEKIADGVKARQQPRRDALEAKDLNDLLDIVREDRIKQAADEEFEHAYGAHSWLLCTARSERGTPWFEDLKQLAAAAPEVIGALKETYDDLELARRRLASGKS